MTSPKKAAKKAAPKTPPAEPTPTPAPAPAGPARVKVDVYTTQDVRDALDAYAGKLGGLSRTATAGLILREWLIGDGVLQAPDAVVYSRAQARSLSYAGRIALALDDVWGQLPPDVRRTLRAALPPDLVNGYDERS